MKRADDFRKFIENHRTSAESIDLLPEIPDGCELDYVERVEAEVPVAECPYAMSDIRDGGLKIWDSVYLPMPKVVSMDPKRPRDLSTLRSTNSEWESTKESLSMVGKPDGVHYLRPKGKYILDLMNSDIRILQGAHIITHRTMSSITHDDYTFGQLADEFLRNLIKIFLAMTYKLPMNVHPEDLACSDAFDRYGIEVFGSTALRSPVLQAASSGVNCRIKPDKTVVTVLGAVGIEAHPKQAGKSNAWKEINKWSCLPSIVALSGWECVDYLTHAERTELGGCSYYAVPCSDLQEMSSFGEVVDAAVANIGSVKTSAHVVMIDEWLDSEDFKKGLSVTPQLPCPTCIRINTSAEGVVTRPRTRKPNKGYKDISESTVPEMVAWADYVRFMRGCISIGRTATAYALGSITSVSKRNVAARKRDEKLRHIEYLNTKYLRKLNNGFISEAESVQQEIYKLRRELDES